MDTGFSSHRPRVRGLADDAHSRPESFGVHGNHTVTELIFVGEQRFTNCAIKAFYDPVIVISFRMILFKEETLAPTGVQKK